MSVLRLILREIAWRKLSFFLGLVSVVAAVGCLVGSLTILRAHDLQTRAILAQKEEEVKTAMAALEDDYRKISLKLGFNLLILPKDQNLSELYEADFGSKTMPEEYVARIAKSDIVTIQHLLPILQQRVKWPERERTILLAGVRGEVPLAHGDTKKPLLEAVPAGGIVLGAELHRSLGLKEGDTVRLMGRDFNLVKCQPEKGDKDDITAWINLAEAQDMLGKKGLINGIMALECGCAWANVPAVRADLANILPDTQVIEQAGKALTRAESRFRATDEVKATYAREDKMRAALRSQREKLASVLVPLAVAGAALWIAFLSLANVRERRAEIGVLRAVGLRTSQILSLFLGRALAIGLVGGVAGFGAVWGAATWGARALGHAEFAAAAMDKAFALGLFGAAMGLAIVVSALGGWLPAMIAAQQDPAAILREE